LDEAYNTTAKPSCITDAALRPSFVDPWQDDQPVLSTFGTWRASLLEHVSSTGINDCETDFSDCFQTNRRQQGRFGFACFAKSNRTCSLPRADIFETFWEVSDVNKDGRLTEAELGVVAACDCTGPPTTPCECALPRRTGDCQLGDDEFIAQQARASEPEGIQRVFWTIEDYFAKR